MNFLDQLLAQLMPQGGGAADAGQYEPPMLPQMPMPRDAGTASRRAAGAIANQAEAPGIEPGRGSADGEGLNLLGRLGEFLGRPPEGGPPDLPPMARGMATAAPDMPANAAGRPNAMPPGLAIGAMPAASSAPDLLSMFARSSQGNPRGVQVPTAAGGGATPPAIGPFATSVQPAQANSFLDGIKNSPWAPVLMEALRGGMAGAAATPNSPNAGALRAVGAGYTLADQQATKRQQAEAAAKRQALLDTLAVRKDAREQTGQTAELGLKKNADARADRTEQRLAEDSKVKNQLAVEKLMRLKSDGTLPVDARFKLQDQLIRYADKINKNGLMQPAELEAALAKEQRRLEDYYGVRRQPQAAAGAASPITRRAVGPDGKEVTLMLQNGQWVPAP